MSQAILASLPSIFQHYFSTNDRVSRVRTEILCHCTDETMIDVIAELIVSLLKMREYDVYAQVIDKALDGLGHHGFSEMLHGMEYDKSEEMFFPIGVDYVCGS
jgi:hypothetical protein